jgi:dynein intermediate chain 2
VGGSYNGLIGFWDLRKGSLPVENSVIEKSHKDPVYDVYWIQSRTGNECCSVSTDGQVLWWDIRKLAGGPMDNMVLSSEQGTNYGGTSMEYKSDAGATRYLVGTEQGVVLLLDRKPKKDSESQKGVKNVFGVKGGKHHGPIYSVQRNPVHSKYFLTIGDWTARVWMEDLRSPIMTTKYDNSYLTGGCWSPTRPGVFFTTKVDGTMDVWDFFHKQHECVFSTKVGDAGLSSIRPHQSGKLIALGSMDGSTTVLELSDALSELQREEKSAIGQMLEREQKREKNLEMRVQRKKDTKEQKETKEPSKPKAEGKMRLIVQKEDEVDVEKLIKQAEEQFFKTIQQQDEAASKSDDKKEEGKTEAVANGTKA